MVSLRSNLAGARTVKLHAQDFSPAASPPSPRSPGGRLRPRRGDPIAYRLPLALLLWLVVAGAHARQPERPSPLLVRWLASRTNLLTWSADVTQVRSLKTLAQPLTAHGQVWFAAPNRFRWELRTPSQTIAVREPDQLLVIYPKLKRAERFALHGPQAGPWKDTMALLEAGFPRSQLELEGHFHVLSQSVTGEICQVALQPKAASARRLMPQITLAFSTNDFSLHATELQFADGSTMRNEFSNARINPPLEASLFTPQPDPDVKIVEPMKKP
jgi:outer membrane lipoprotein-sorting protein